MRLSFTSTHKLPNWGFIHFS